MRTIGNSIAGFACVAFTSMLLTGCLKDEIPVEPFDRGDVQTAMVEMGDTYGKQIWFDLGTKSAVRVADKDIWDIAFDCRDGHNLVYLNAALLAQATATSKEVLEEVNQDDIDNAFFKPDHQSGAEDSLAIGDPTTGSKVYVIHRGYDTNGSDLGHIRIQFISVVDGMYAFRWGPIGGTEVFTSQVMKDAQYNVVGFSFTTHEAVLTEPPKANWDICFTQYVHVFYDPYTPYLVTGVLINPYEVEVAQTESLPFSSMTYDEAMNLAFISERNAIGYEWKYYDFDAGLYAVNPDLVYAICDTEGIYYKLHFIDFYNDAGEKGAPTFEFQAL
ncbi:MAG: HmuY family protein [Flavobacteriales bacterium]|nr:HmuY family protein [Flavobacteriales bacterium]